VIDHVIDLNGFFAVSANESDCLSDGSVFYRQNVCRLPGYNMRCTNQYVRLRRLFARHQSVQQCGCFITCFFGIESDTRHRRIGQITDQLVVVDPDDRHLIGHLQSGDSAGLDNTATGHVISGHQAHGFR
jgi:hypothetical protein